MAKKDILKGAMSKHSSPANEFIQASQEEEKPVRHGYKDPEDVKSARILVALTEEQREKIRDAAFVYGCSDSEVVRRALDFFFEHNLSEIYERLSRRFGRR